MEKPHEMESMTPLSVLPCELPRPLAGARCGTGNQSEREKRVGFRAASRVCVSCQQCFIRSPGGYVGTYFHVGRQGLRAEIAKFFIDI